MLYASSQRLGAFLETLARFRIDPAVQAAMTEIEDDDRDTGFPTLSAGVVPGDWLTAPCIGGASHAGPFADIGHSDSLAHLRVALASRLVHYGFDDLGAGDLRLRVPRCFSQAVSRHVFEHGRTVDGAPLLGIRYLSRLGDELVNWAIFEGTDPDDPTSKRIAPDDPDLHEALAKYDLRLSLDS